MSYNDIIGTIGGALSCYAAILLLFWPFIILEAIWTVVTVLGLIKAMSKKQA